MLQTGGVPGWAPPLTAEVLGVAGKTPIVGAVRYIWPLHLGADSPQAWANVPLCVISPWERDYAAFLRRSSQLKSARKAAEDVADAKAPSF